MELSALENWLWDAACSIRGAIDAPKYREYVLPLLLYKRLSDVYEDELDRLAGEFGDRELAGVIEILDRHRPRPQFMHQHRTTTMPNTASCKTCWPAGNIMACWPDMIIARFPFLAWR